MVSQCCQDPAFGHKHCGLHFGLVPGPSDEELLSCSVLFEGNIKPFDPLAVKVAELTVLVALRVCLFVLVSEELKFQLQKQILH